ncbi:MAG TPA: GAF domain-containing protein [Candidatus Sulfotelmatobacter sp.]|jgi:GAF domain-containing protein|nr:GAF domain-containing protein [Candidatus Sulfotelmatobacter sp.]
MAAITSAVRPALSNRRRRVRHKIQTPAYASFTTESKGAMLDLHEIVDISEEGLAIQCISPLEADERVNLCLDLAECAQPIYTAAKVIWAASSGRAGLRFSDLPPASLSRLREWLFLNAMAGVANAEAAVVPIGADRIASRPDYTDTLTAVTAVQREVEALGADLAGALQLIAARAQTLVRASGSAIALATANPDFMDCRASAGPGAPPVGARLQVGSGFSGECVKSGRLLRCDDAEVDSRVDRESCLALGIRSILAVPVRVGDKSIGILEAFSGQADAFSEADSRVMQRLAETLLAAVNRAARAENLPTLEPPSPAVRFAPTPGSVLFASAPVEKNAESAEEKSTGGISLPRSHLILLVCFAATIFGVLWYVLAPLIQTRLRDRGQGHLQTVLASSQAPKSDVLAAPTSIETATIEQLREMAEHGNPSAENALGLRYFQGEKKDGIPQDEREAFRWFTRAAEHGSLAAQSKLGFLYWSGRGVPKDFNKAYFWTVLARARGDEGSRDLAAVLASGMTRAQAATIEEQAGSWLQQSTAKPAPGH